MGGDDQPLRGRVVLLTRPVERGRELARRLESLGARVECRPTIALDPPRDAAATRRALDHIERYDWLVFTSAHGVRFFLSALEEAGAEERALGAQIAAVGPATAAALRKHGLEPSVVAEESRSEGLAEALIPELRPGQRLLHVRPEVAREALHERLLKADVRVDSAPFYRNVVAPESEQLAREIREDRFHIVVFTSPSTLQRLLEADPPTADSTRRALRRAALVAIGGVTEAAITRAGLSAAAVANAPTDEGLLEAIRAVSERP